MANGTQTPAKQRALFAATAQGRPSRRRLLLAVSDIGLPLMVLIVIAVLASMLISYGDEAVMQSAGESPLSSVDHTAVAPPLPHELARRTTALEHSRKHMQPGYQCLQHPEVILKSPGTCPICGEQLRWTDEAGAEDAFLEADATVMAGQKRLKNVALFGSGWIDRLLVDQAGAEVQQGDLLLEVYAPELMTSTERQEGLVRLYAPVAGRVQAIHAEQDKFVASGTVVMQIEDRSSVWLKSTLSSAEAARVRAGQAVALSLPDAQGRVLMGEVDEVVINRRDQGDVTVWLRFDDDPLLHRDSQVTVRIHARAGTVATSG